MNHLRSKPFAGALLGRLAGAAIVLLVLAGFPAGAAAGHYDLVDVPELVSPELLPKLEKAGVSTTAQLLERTAELAARKKLARASGIPLRKLTAWAHFCDLLRIDGVGPIMARLFQAAKVMNVKMMSKQEPEDLLKRVTAANAKTRVTELLPGVEHLRAWIAQAKTLPVIVQ